MLRDLFFNDDQMRKVTYNLFKVVKAKFKKISNLFIKLHVNKIFKVDLIS